MRQPQVVVVGAGIVGLSTAYALLARGVKNVTVLEQETVDHRRGTSHGISRLLRFEYGSDIFYSQMVRLSLSRWKQLELAAQRTLYTRTGLLVLGAGGDKFTQPSFHAMRALKMPVERLSHQLVEKLSQRVLIGDPLTHDPLLPRRPSRKEAPSAGAGRHLYHYNGVRL